MNEEILSRLRGRLKRRSQALKDASADFYPSMLRRFHAFLHGDAVLTPILAELRQNGYGSTAAEAAKEAGDNPMGGVYPPPQKTPVEIETLDNDANYAAYAYCLVRGVCVEDWDLGKICLVVYHGDPEARMECDFSTFHEQVIEPLCADLDERLDEQQAILGLLVRYKHRCEWFNRRALLDVAKDEQAATGDDKKRAEIEKVLKEDLYRWLHDQGVEFMIEPKSDKGEIDLIADQAEGGRKHLEGKVFDNAGRNKGYIVKGFGQLLHYLRQYNAASGYLLIYKTCEAQLVIDGAEQIGTVPFVRCEGKTVFVLVVDICEYEKAVSQRTYQPVRISADELKKADPS